MRPAWLLLGLLPLPAMAMAACPLPATAPSQGAAQLAWTAVGGTITVGQPFVLEMQLCPANATLTRVDATMPEHRHGMNYRPSITALGDGRWRAEGLMFHMPGRWQLQWDVRVAGRTENLVDSVHLP